MTRVLFLGNSHLAAVREAWGLNPGRWPGLQATFLGAHKDLLLQSTVQDGQLVAATDNARTAFQRLNGVTGVDLRAADLVVICGCLVAALVAAGLWRDARWPGLPSLADEPDLAGLRPTLISAPAARAALAGMLEQRLGLKLARHLRAGHDGPILLASQPRVSAVVRRKPRPEVRALVQALGAGDGPALSALFDTAAALAAARAGATWLPQPAQTIEAGLLTALPYIQGATRLTAAPGLAQPEDDITHANAAYGAAVLDQVAGLT